MECNANFVSKNTIYININLSNGNHNTHGTANVEAIYDTVYVNDSLSNSNQEINVSNYDYNPNDITKKHSYLDVIVGDKLNLSED